MKYKITPCKECKDDNLRPTIKGLCQYHYRQERAKVYKERGKNKIKKAKAPSGEMKLFEKLFDEREKICFVTDVKLNSKEYYKATNRFHFLFHHVLTKQAYPSFRLNPDNIIMILPRVHMKIETQSLEDLVKEHDGYRKVIELKQRLKSEYYEQSYKRTV